MATILYVSGASPASGTDIGASAAYPGPYYVERQTMTFQYTRIPRYTSLLNFDLSNVTLSGIDQVDFTSNGGSIIVATVKASYEVKKDYATYNTSSFQQTQEFEFGLQTSADPYGRTYGSPSDASAAYDSNSDGAMDISAVGIQGICLTSRPWIYRRPWVEGTDSEVSLTTTGTTYVFSQDTGVISQYSSPRNKDFSFDQQIYAADYFRYVGNLFQAGCLVDQDDIILNKANLLGFIPGNFEYSRDLKAGGAVNLINSIGELVNQQKLYAIPATVSTGTPNSPIPDQGIPQFTLSGKATFANWDAIV
jgi:hypothetical protein